MQGQNIKVEAHALVEHLSDEASWDDLMQTIYVRQAIESGLADSRTGRGSRIELFQSGVNEPSPPQYTDFWMDFSGNGVIISDRDTWFRSVNC